MLVARNVALVRVVQPNALADRPGPRFDASLTCRNALAPANPLSRPPLLAIVTSAPYASLVEMLAYVRVITPAVSSVRIVRTASTVCRKKGVSWSVRRSALRCNPSSRARMYSGFR